MDPLHSPVAAPADVGSLSRRSVVLGTAVGISVDMVTRGGGVARAQDATPSPDATPEAEGGLPPGMAFIPLTNVPIREEDVPQGPFMISVYRVTHEPGAVVPKSTFAYPSFAYVESGTLTCPGAAPRYLIGADGTVQEIGEEDVPVNPGEGSTFRRTSSTAAATTEPNCSRSSRSTSFPWRRWRRQPRSHVGRRDRGAASDQPGRGARRAAKTGPGPTREDVGHARLLFNTTAVTYSAPVRRWARHRARCLAVPVASAPRRSLMTASAPASTSS